MNLRRANVLLMGLWVGAWMCGLAKAQTTEAGVKARLLGKPLYLRGMWAENRLEFDADGQPAQGYRATSFTVAGIDVTQVQLHGAELRLKGVRVETEFAAHPEGERKPLLEDVAPKVKPVVIQMVVKGQRGGDFGKALDAIFADGLGDLTPDLPAIWQTYARQHFVAGAANPAKVGIVVPRGEKTDAGEPVVQGMRRGDPRPQLLKRVDPQFSEVARRMKVSGNVMVHLWVGPDGVPTHVEIARPAGFGLDEEAVEAVDQYRFSPPMRDGQPVTLDLNIDVNFQIF